MQTSFSGLPHLRALDSMSKSFLLSSVHFGMVGVTSIVKPGSVGHLMELKQLYENQQFLGDVTIIGCEGGNDRAHRTGTACCCDRCYHRTWLDADACTSQRACIWFTTTWSSQYNLVLC